LKKKLFLAAFILFLLVFVVFAVDWYPVLFKHGWNQRSSGFCSLDSQCLVSPAGSHALDGMPEMYFSDPKPYCINNSQFVLDNYCDAGSWTSRTKLLAIELLRVAEVQSSNDFSLFCGLPEIALNNLDYRVDNVLITEYLNNCNPHGSSDDYPCVNSVCVLRYSDGVAFGTSLNMPIDDSGKSFLKALDKSRSACNSAKNNDQDFDLCSDNVWYNHDTESVIVLPESYLGSVLPSATAVNILNNYFIEPFNQVKSFAQSINTVNLSFYENTGLFNNLYFARKGSKEVFAFLEKDQTLFGYDFVGIKMSGFVITNICSDVIDNFDSDAFCSDSADIVVVARKTPNMDDTLVDAWPDITAKLRLS
jgi:hypothetical protein